MQSIRVGQVWARQDSKFEWLVRSVWDGWAFLTPTRRSLRRSDYLIPHIELLCVMRESYERRR